MLNSARQLTGNIVRRIQLRRLRVGDCSSSRPAAERASADDLYHCYRLLLRREPDEAGWNHWENLINHHHITLQFMVDGFVYSDEFRRLQEEGFRPRLIELDGFKLYVRSNDYFVGAEIARSKVYEPFVTSEIRRRLGTGMIFVDIGANIGYFTMLGAALVGPSGGVYAFEPNPDNCELIEKSIAINGFGQVRLYPVAVAEAPQSFRLDVGGTSSNGRIIDFSPQAVPGGAMRRLVQAVTLDDTLEDLEKIDVIKMDIEGAEPRAWKGMSQLIARHHPLIIFEMSPSLIQTTSHVSAEAFLDEVCALNYRLYVLDSTESANRHALSTTELLIRYTKSGSTHLDLLALPG